MSTSGNAVRSSFIRADWSEPAWLPPPMWLIDSLCFLPPAAGAAAAGLVGSTAGLAASVGAAGWAGLAAAAGAVVGVGAAGCAPQAASTTAVPPRATDRMNPRRLKDRLVIDIGLF